MSNPELTPDRDEENSTGAPWGFVCRDLGTYDDPETRLPAIDQLEAFRAVGPCLYRRVIVPVRAKGTGLQVCLYVVEDGWTESFKELTGGIWR